MADYFHLPLTKRLVCEAMEFVKVQTAAQLVLLRDEDMRRKLVNELRG